jgi:hypothetical protein
MAAPSRSTLVLIAVVAVLGFAARGETLRTQLTRPKPLTALDQRQIHKIALECKDCPRRALEKITGRWVLDEPYDMPADPAQVERLLSLAAAPVRHRRPVKDIDVDEAGLNPAKSAVTLGTVRIEFGGRDPVRRQRYVRRGDEVALVADSFAELPKITAEALVDPRPFAGLKGGATLDDKPLPEPALAKLRDLRADKVQPAPANARGRTLRFEAPGAPEFQFVRYGDQWQIVRPNPGLAYVLGKDAADVLLEPEKVASAPR